MTIHSENILLNRKRKDKISILLKKKILVKSFPKNKNSKDRYFLNQKKLLSNHIQRKMVQIKVSKRKIRLRKDQGIIRTTTILFEKESHLYINYIYLYINYV